MTAPAQAEPETPPNDTGNRRRVTKTGLVIGMILTLLVGVLVGIWANGALAGRESAQPSPDSVDVGFSQDMTVHHNQAVEMSAMALTNATDPAVRTLAYDVVTTQQSQVGTMQGWLSLWDRPSLGSGGYMKWMPAHSTPATMDHSMPGMDAATTSDTTPARMPGMATTDELDELRRTTGPAFDVRYLQLLLRHHQGGIPMAQYAADHASVSAVAVLARQIASTQQAESTAIENLLRMKGAQPLPMN